MIKRASSPSRSILSTPRLALLVAAIAMAATPAASRDESLAQASNSDTDIEDAAPLPSAVDGLAFTVAFAPFSQPATPGQRPEAVDITTIEPAREEASDLGSGIASYYGRRFHGRPTANGERFDMAELTAAHKTLPFGSRVRVINKANGREVVVRINDRGPFVRGRHIDLSRRAAEEIGMIGSGHASVRMELLDS